MRVLTRFVVAAVLVSPALLSATPSTAGEDALAEAKRRVTDAKDAANAVAAQINEAQSRYEVLGD